MLSNLSAVQILTLGSPSIAGLFALSFLALAHHNARARHLKVLALSFLLFALASVVQILGIPPDVGWNAIISGALYAGCVIFLAEGVLGRVGARQGAAFKLAAFFVIVGGMYYFYYVSNDLVARICVLNFGSAAVLLLSAVRLSPLLKGRPVDKVLFWLFLAFALSFFPRTWLTLGQIHVGMGARAFGTSSFWIALHMTLVLFGIALAVVLILAAAMDKIDDLNRERNEDHLTGLLNRRGFDEYAAELGRRGTDGPVSLIACDIDHFKQINDRYGHAAGDQVLRQTARLIRHTLRAGDAGSRAGGEEFLILLPGTRAVDAYRVAQRIRIAIETQRYAGLPESVRITASFGVAERAPWESMDGFVARVDALLYEAKRLGRNRVEVAGGAASVIA
ncbi:MAG: GGDEF domain-containing protein [Pigmentiphaga sp.]|uniref:GGDEF domain-containing protein n=1 Tax=Pigmentiphaga sp. TaxID=1977564 RepID=UPI0029A6F322|nr:GGDEF domain-containing protein [Pigmentiphaga sp.]MDX3904642.1 GGDEF domain-containing protein [Pigmentiphaga sp.]